MVAAPDSVPALLSVSDLCVTYHGEQTVRAVRNLSYQLRAGETLGIVGESGSGKTQGALALMGLLPDTADVSGSAILVQENTTDRDLLTLDQDALNTVRGSAMAMIFQDPMTALNPHLTIGRQMSRVLERHRGMSRADALSAAADMLDAVRVPEARARLAQYPHEMSGGMRQRIMIATALLCRPSLLIADEPTTALDVTVQAQILELMADLQRELGTAILLITHDMGVVAANCDRVLVMKDGVERETGDVGQIFAAPADQYTKDLLAAVPRLDASSSAISPTDAVESSASSE
ncbi:MAG: ABC transporter ATP-binding protein, partial [Gammaproteobacteria bacterium]|nr:ABC transporter ATP-binding protein [Gammaproteobacteria bacterium]